MTKKEFTEEIAKNADFGILQFAAQYSLETNQIDKYVKHLIDQYNDIKSRRSVERMLGNELTNAFKKFI
jgi:hypothetical protein